MSSRSGKLYCVGNQIFKRCANPLIISLSKDECFSTKGEVKVMFASLPLKVVVTS